jgi:hypothetical protein
MSGGAYTLNQIVPADALKFTKGWGALKKYTYKGDSGTLRPPPLHPNLSSIH